jgi:hypothetical protein
MIKNQLTSTKFIVFLCLIVTFLYFSPFLLGSLRGYHPELKFFGDLQIAGYPAFIQAGKYFDDLIFFGIDFFTANGSSSFFNRPNVPSYYLPQVIIQSIVTAESNNHAAHLFVFQMWINGFLAMLFTSLWLNRIARVNIYASIIGGTVFFSLISFVYSQIAFFNVASIFPMVVYALSISILKDTGFYDKMLLSIPLVVILTAGYLPIAVMGVVVSVAFVLLYSISLPDIKPKYKDFFFVLFIGFIIIFGFLVTVVNAVSITPTIPRIPFIETLYFSDLSLKFKGVLSLFIPSVANDSGEAPHFRLGLPLLFLLYISYKQVTDDKSQNLWKRNLFVILLVVFFSSTLLAMGRYSGLADIFFYTIPGLGEMHIYARYMLIFVFFLAIAIAIGMSNTYSINKNLSLKYPAFATMIGFLLIIFFPGFLIKNQISVQALFIELFVVLIIMLILKLRGSDKFLLFLVPFVVIHQGSLSYVNINWTSMSNKGNTSIDIVNNSSRMNGLINYFYNNTDKQFIKYIDLSPEVEKPGGVPQNFPWFIRYDDDNPRRISSYMGYDQGLAQQLEYAQKFSYYGTYDKKYLIESGVDYVIYDQKTKEKEKEWLLEVVDKNIAEYDIGFGYFAVKILQKKSNTDLQIFDNGIFKTLTNDPEFVPGVLKTNWASEIIFDTNSSQPQTVYFQLFPHKYWKYELNDNIVPVQLTSSNLAYFNLPPGKNSLRISYSNLSNKLFVYGYMGFILLICLIRVRNYIKNKGFYPNA